MGYHIWADFLPSFTCDLVKILNIFKILNVIIIMIADGTAILAVEEEAIENLQKVSAQITN